MSGLWHNPVTHFIGTIVSFMVLTTALIYVVSGLSPAVTWNRTIATIAGVSTGVTVGSVPVAVDSFQQGRGANGGTDGSLFGDGVQPPPPAPTPTPAPQPPAVAAPAPAPAPTP